MRNLQEQYELERLYSATGVREGEVPVFFMVNGKPVHSGYCKAHGKKLRVVLQAVGDKYHFEHLPGWRSKNEKPRILGWFLFIVLLVALAAKAGHWIYQYVEYG